MSLPKYAAYKDSGVKWLGEIPESWSLKPLWTLFRRVKYTDFVNEELLSVYRDYGVIPKSSRDDNNNKPSEDLSPYQLVKVGDLVINKMKAWQGSVAISQYRGIVSPAYFVYESHNQEDLRYLHYLMRSPRYITGYMTLSKGIRVNQWDLEPQYHSRMRVVLPPLQEQTLIAQFLDRETAKIDELITEQEKLITLLDEKRQAMISHAVTKGLNPNAPMKDSGVEWLGEVPESWEVIKLKKNIHLIESGVSVNSIDVAVLQNEFGVLKTSSVYGNIFDYRENKAVLLEEYDRVSCPVRKHTLIVSRMNTPELVGACGFVSDDLDYLFLPDRLWQVYLKTPVPQFIHYWASSNYYRLQVKMVCTGTSSSMQNLSQDQFKSFLLAIPNDDEQAAIVTYLDKKTAQLDTLKAEAQRGIELLKERRSAFISAAVTGKIDVRHAVTEQVTT